MPPLEAGLQATPTQFDSSDGRVPCIELSHGRARALVTLQGGQVLSWIPACGGERLYRSPATRYGVGRSIRAGIPVVFPQFADQGPLPRHGFARTQDWSFAGVVPDSSRLAAVFTLRDNDHTRSLWPHHFELALQVSLDEDTLVIVLVVRNTGHASFRFACALHSYLRVHGLASTTLEGLCGATCLDRPSGSTPFVDAAPVVSFGPEIDRIYLGNQGCKRLLDDQQGLTIDARGFADTVVWNPGALLASGMTDIAPGDHEHFICVEPACVQPCVELSASGVWRGTLRVTAFIRG